MKNIYLLFAGLAMAGSVFAQPYTHPQAINPADTGKVSSPSRKNWVIYEAVKPIVVDGVKDSLWDLVTPQTFDRYIMCRTAKDNETGAYSCKPEEKPNRMPSSPDDFSGSFRVIYDEDYIYTYYDVTDNEVNDGVVNSGLNERLEFVEAPYTDSVQQIWNGSYPPYSGTANAIQKKFAYWNYLGAFKFNFLLIANGKCNISIDQKADALEKINYAQRESACQCGWKLKADGTGYILEAALSLKVALADSSNAPYRIPEKGLANSIAFDMFMFDKDLGVNQIKASWNAEDDCVWDEMLYTGKLTMFRWFQDLKGVESDKGISFTPNPAIDMIKLSERAASVQIISMSGMVVYSASNVSEINVQNLASGIYAIIVDGKAAGKFLKQ